MSRIKKIGIIFALVCVLAGGAAYALRKAYVVPILMYHQVFPGAAYQNRLAVSSDTFERQMKFLKERHYNVMPLAEVAELLRARKAIPAKTVVLTFDDGNKDNYQFAFPILQKYGLPATMFIITDEVGRPQNDRVNWDQIRQMHASGIFTFGSHCTGPDPLIKIGSPEELRRQVVESKRILEEKMGVPVTMFSYPEGMYNEIIVQAVKDAGYRCAVATNPGRGVANDDVFLLKRLRISENSKNLFVFWFESNGFYTFFKESKKAHKQKYAL